MDRNEIFYMKWYLFSKGEFLEWEGLKGRGLKGDLEPFLKTCNGCNDTCNGCNETCNGCNEAVWIVTKISWIVMVCNGCNKTCNGL